MYHDNQTYREYGNGSYNRESEHENPYGSNEFNYESEGEYELSPEYEFNNENEYEGEYAMNEYEGEYENEAEAEYEGEYEREYEGGYEGEAEGEYETEYEDEMQQEAETGGHKDEMEAELEYVTNEAEFNNWVNEIVVRDHRAKNMRPVLRTPIGRNALKQFSRIATRVLPYLGRRKGGWTRPFGTNRHWHRRPGHGGYQWGNRNFRHPYWKRYRHGWGNQFPPGTLPFQNQAFQQQSFQDTGASIAQQQSPQDGSFRNFILDTIKNLSDQIAAGNQSIEALKNSMANSAATHMPGLVQPQADPGSPPGNTPPPDAGQGTPPQSESEMEDYEYNMEYEGEYADHESNMSEEMELQLASELLAVNNESELDHFLGKLLKGAVSAVSGVLKSPEGSMLKKLLKKVAKKAIPLVGGAVGSVVAPGVGTVIGKNVGNALVNGEIFELELEGLSNEDREFETAKAFIRFAGNAANQVMANQAGSPQDNVRQGVTTAARHFAPGLLLSRRRIGRRRFRRSWFGGNMDNGQSGTWYRKGNRIIIENAG